ncbi:plasmid mobilization protein [Agrobacterium tumefaciens]|uniref:plasmid mobilization protein n=1 Tax=Agrobacterium tumefaciens TaxID=358 RepID=UPI001574E818|nr:hypothetical protein [Agrobacterium tumefaciens]NTB05856.1 hypothetical protein [Agrobacterium tumefaciens]
MAPKTDTKKTQSIRMRLSDEMKSQLEARAAERNLSMTDYLIRAGMNRPTRQRADVDAINELRQCAEELKAMHATMQQLLALGCAAPISSGAMDAQMAAITEAIGRVWVSASGAA